MQLVRDRTPCTAWAVAGWGPFIACFANVCTAQYIPFTQEARQRGIVYIMDDMFPSGSFGSGCGFADLDSDGDQDIVVMGGTVTTNGPIGTIGLFENNGSGHFTLRSVESGIPVMPKASAFAAADYDADGLVDLFISQMGAENALFRNLDGFHFEDVTAAAGILDPGPNMGAAWADFDNDGWLDLHLCSYNNALPGFNQNDKLYRNLGNGTFADVSEAQGIADNGLAFQSVWFDYDRDGDVDLYVSQDRGHFAAFPENKLYRNDGGTLVNVSQQSGAGLGLFSMGLACGDFDGNSWPDIYVTNLPGYPGGYNRLLLNQGNGTFVESSAQAGVAHWASSWGTIFFDFDNNGAQDLYVNNQWVANTMYANSGAFPCLPVNVGVGGNTGLSFTSAIADVDNDGDMDLLLNNLGRNIELFINHHASPTSRWLEYRVVGVHPNLNAIGANVDTRIGSVSRFREIMAGGNGYKGQNDLTVHVGVGAAPIADEIIVRWPGGSPVRTFTGIPTNVRWTMYPPTSLGDADGNAIVNATDFQVFADCYGQLVSPGMEMMDFDGNWRVDQADFELFLKAYAGDTADCDEDGQLDLAQILSNPALDLNRNGMLDACEQNPADIDGDGAVNVNDLLMVINAWGPCSAPCPADVVANGVVDVNDLLMVINNWS